MPDACDHIQFSSPHGDFSFSIETFARSGSKKTCFRPLTGISLFLLVDLDGMAMGGIVFVPSRGFLFFYEDYVNAMLEERKVFVPSRGFLFFYENEKDNDYFSQRFSSPHGDFSFSIHNVIVARR